MVSPGVPKSDCHSLKHNMGMFVPSGNQPWQWTMKHISVTALLLYKPSIPRVLSIAMVDYQMVIVLGKLGDVDKKVDRETTVNQREQTVKGHFWA